MSSPLLADAREILEWANQKIDKIDLTAQAFFESKPYETVERVESDVGVPINIGGTIVPLKNSAGPVRVVVLKLAKPLNKNFRHLVREALQSIRSPLDYAVVSLCEARGLDADTVKPTFPIAETDHAFKSQIGRLKEKGVSGDILDFFRSEKLKPSWDECLVPLHELNAHEKHRRLTAIAAVATSDTIVGPTTASGGVAIVLPTSGDLEDGIPVAHLLSADAEFKGYLRISPDIRFGNISQFGEQDCGATLRFLARAVGDVLERFEASLL